VPSRPETYFCWQIGVANAARERGLATRLLQDVIREGGFRFLEATVTPSNDVSKAFFSSLGPKLRLQSRQQPTTVWTDSHFSKPIFLPVSPEKEEKGGGGVHEREDLVRIGPLSASSPSDDGNDEIVDFLVRTLHDVEARGDLKRGGLKKWESRRYLTRRDGLGFSFHHTVMYPKKPSFQWYPNHVEAVLIVEGQGTIEIVTEGTPHSFERGTGQLHELGPGSCYVLRGEKHILEATSEAGMHCICVFNPPVAGSEDHDAETGAYPAVDDMGQQHFGYGADFVPALFKPPVAFRGGSRYQH
jgi:L-ectoine synthase